MPGRDARIDHGVSTRNPIRSILLLTVPAAAAVLLAVLTAAVSPPVALATAPPAKPPAKTPATTTPKPGSPAHAAAIRAANLKAGKALFAQLGCGACHTLGAARAVGTAGPNLDIIGLPAAEIVRQLTRGSIAMPSFRNRLTAKQISQLAGYIAASARARTSRPRDAKSLFLGYCGSCHVLQAAGSRGTIAVNLDLTRSTAEQVISALVTKHPLSMGFGVHFSGPELAAIAAFVAGPADAPPPAATTTAAGG